MPSTVYYNDRSFKKGSARVDHDSFQTVLRKTKIKEPGNKNRITTLNNGLMIGKESGK